MSIKSLYQPEQRKSLSHEEEQKLATFGVALLAHMRDLMLQRRNPFQTLDEVYLVAKKEEMDVHLARLHPDKPSDVLYEQIDHVATVALGVVDLSQGAFDYTSQPALKQEVYA